MPGPPDGRGARARVPTAALPLVINSQIAVSIHTGAHAYLSRNTEIVFHVYIHTVICVHTHICAYVCTQPSVRTYLSAHIYVYNVNILLDICLVHVQVYMCMYTHTHICIEIYILFHIWLYTYEYMCTHIHTAVYICTHMYTYILTTVWKYTGVYKGVSTVACVCIQREVRRKYFRFTLF